MGRPRQFIAVWPTCTLTVSYTLHSLSSAYTPHSHPRSRVHHTDCVIHIVQYVICIHPALTPPASCKPHMTAHSHRGVLSPVCLSSFSFFLLLQLHSPPLFLPPFPLPFLTSVTIFKIYTNREVDNSNSN